MQMAIVKMSKFNLLAFDSNREDLLHELQKFDYVHFQDLKEDSELEDYELENIEDPESIVAINEEINKVKYGIDILSRYEEKQSALKAMQEGMETMEYTELEERALKIDYQSICNQIIKLTSEIEKLSQDIGKINVEIEELSPWIKLETPIKDLKAFRQVELMVGTVPNRLKQKLSEELVSTKYTYYEILSEDKENLYVLIMTSKEEEEIIKEILRKYSYSNVKIGIEGEPALKITELKEEISSKKEEISSCKEQLSSLAGENSNLQIVYEYLKNNKLKITESENFLTTDSVNVIEGYVPTDMEGEFTQIVKNSLDNVYYLELEEAEKEDSNAPILLENGKFSRSFESLTTMYALPKYNEIDPTPLYAAFYSFFFGMMVADAGYGLVLLLATTFVLKFFNLTEKQADGIRFYFYHSISTIFWGLIYGSFFSFSIPTGILDPGTQYNQVLILSMAIGIVHIYFALGVSAYLNIRDGKPLDALYDTGFWYMALTGVILVLLGTQVALPEIVSTVSLYVMIAGMVGIVLTGGRDSTGIGARLAGGAYSLYGISSYVGDFVSYSRLMALGLSGGFIASAINDMVFMLFETNIVGILVGIVVFIGGHMFNLFLSALSGYVHSIRLTYVEFFGKFYEGGGTAFKFLRSKSKYISIK